MLITSSRPGRTLLYAALGAVLLGSAAPRSSSADDSAPVETFDAAWTLVRDTFFDPEMNGVDWDAVRAELLPAAQAADSPEALRPVIRDMLSRLNLSHFALIPQSAADLSDWGQGGDGTAGLDIRFLDGRAVVFSVTDEGPADRAGVQPGWIVHEIDGDSVDEMFTQFADQPTEYLHHEHAHARVLHALSGEVDAKTEVVFLDGRGKKIKKKLRLDPIPGEPAKFGNLPTFYPKVEREQLILEDNTEVGLIRFNIWMPAVAPSVDDAVDFFRDSDGMILDLRGNPGGVGALAMGMAGHFSSDKSSLGTMAMRDNSLEFKINPRTVNSRGESVKPFSGPLAILMDKHSASTSEVFVGGLQSLGRARVFGETSAGAALPAHATDLPNGDKLLHAVADFVRPDGERIEGRGIIPDHAVPLTREALLEGRDPALRAALDWIQDETRNRP